MNLEVDGQRHLDAKAAAAGAALQLQPRRAHEAAHTAHLSRCPESLKELSILKSCVTLAPSQPHNHRVMTEHM